MRMRQRARTRPREGTLSMRTKPHWITCIAIRLGAKYALWKDLKRREMRKQNIADWKR